MRKTQQGFLYYDFIGWLSKTHAVIDGIYGVEDIHPEEIRLSGFLFVPVIQRAWHKCL
jgi:hypothetical protein